MDYNWGMIKVEKDQMSASVTLKMPKDGESYDLSLEMITDTLKNEGIKVKADQEAIENLLSSKRFNKPVVVARGKQPMRGRDGYFTFHVPTDNMRMKPVINPDGSADFGSSMRLAMINEDDVFASYTPATSGEYGYDVFSHMIKPVGGRELPPLHGHGVLSNEDKTEYRAEYSGHMMRYSNTVNIERLYRVHGDVDMTTGDISFEGDIEIIGDVLGGMCVEAGGNIFIHGHVGASILKAGKNIIISKGIQGRDVCTIEAKQNVACKFIEHAEVLAHGSVYANSILNSTVLAHNHIVVNGTILSSNVRGMLSVTAKEVGNDNEVNTLLFSGVPSEEIDRASLLKSQLDDVEEKIAVFNAKLHEFEALEVFTPQLRNLQVQVLRSKILVSTRKKKIENELLPLLDLITLARKSSQVHITGVAHSGITINIFGNSYVVERSVMDIKVYLQNNRLRVDSGQSSDFRSEEILSGAT